MSRIAMLVVVTALAVPANAVRVECDGSILNEEFGGKTLNARLWTESTSDEADGKTPSLIVAGGKARITSSGPDAKYIVLKNDLDYGGLAVPAYEIRFKVGKGSLDNGKATTKESREITLLAGVSGSAPKGANFCLTLLNGDKDTFRLAWNGGARGTGAPMEIAKDLKRGKWHTLLVHFDSNGTVIGMVAYNVYLNGDVVSISGPLTQGISPRLAVGDTAKGAGVDGLEIGFVKVGKVQWTEAAIDDADEQDEPAFQFPAGQRQLFMDDVDVAKIENLKRTMHTPDKKGAVIRPEPSIGQYSIQIRMTPIWSPEKKVWQLWDCAASPIPLYDAGKASSGYYESPDGMHWSKPSVGQVEFQGSKENNYVFAMLNGKRCRIDCLVYDAADPDPARRYKMAVPNIFNHGIGGTAVSPDGIRWTETSSPGIYGGDEWNITLDEQEHLFLYYMKRGSKHGRAIWLSTSKDFKTWSKPELCFQADDLDQELGIKDIKARFADKTLQQSFWNTPSKYKVDVYTMSPFRYESVYLGMPAMYHAVGAPAGYRNTCGYHLVELVSSRDLKNWTRQGDRKPFIGPSRLGSGAYDLLQIIGPASAAVRGDELWFYYTGIKYRTTGELPEAKRRRLDPDAGAICLAVLRRDGFVSLDAGQTKGTVLTQPFKLPAGKLFVNADAFGGELRVDILDAGGKVLAVSKPMKGDLARGEVKWQKGDIADLKGKAASLRFTLRNGQLYSYWLE